MENDNSQKFPHAEAAIKLSHANPDPQCRLSGRESRMIQIVFDKFLQMGDENAKIHEVIEGEFKGVKFPFMKIRISELAKMILRETEPEIKLSEVTKTCKLKKKFVFGSSTKIEEGEHFSYVEEAMSDCMKYLPKMLDKLQKGESIEEDYEIYTMGLPTNEFGVVTDKLLERAREGIKDGTGGPHDVLGEVFSDFIARELQDNNVTSIELYGLSLGNNNAVRTAEKLIKQGVVTQKLKEEREGGLPQLYIRTQSPVSMSDSWVRTVQIAIGFLLDIQLELTRTEIQYIEAGKAGFRERILEVLNKRGIRINMNDEQKKNKWELLFMILRNLGKEFKPHTDLKMTTTFGTLDATTWTPTFLMATVKNKVRRLLEKKGGLGRWTISRKKRGSNVRTTFANMLHLQPRFPAHMQRNMVKTAEIMNRRFSTFGAEGDDRYTEDDGKVECENFLKSMIEDCEKMTDKPDRVLRSPNFTVDEGNLEDTIRYFESEALRRGYKIRFHVENKPDGIHYFNIWKEGDSTEGTGSNK